jgi:hypothetical protein
VFPQHIFSRGGGVPWPDRSPYLSACDCFLSGNSKLKFLSLKPRTIEELQQRIKEEVGAIPEQMTCRVMEYLRERLERCLRNIGRNHNNVLLEI